MTRRIAWFMLCVVLAPLLVAFMSDAQLERLLDRATLRGPRVP